MGTERPTERAESVVVGLMDSLVDAVEQAKADHRADSVTAERRAPGIASTVLTSYLTGQQDDQEWALIDNLNADEARDLAKEAIRLLRDANAIVGLSAVALDPLVGRQQRFAATEAWRSFAEPYVTALSRRFGS